MNKGRLEAFTDAVIAIILTILVLELQPPHSGSLASLWQLRGVFCHLSSVVFDTHCLLE